MVKQAVGIFTPASIILLTEFIAASILTYMLSMI